MQRGRSSRSETSGGAAGKGGDRNGAAGASEGSGGEKGGLRGRTSTLDDESEEEADTDHEDERDLGRPSHEAGAWRYLNEEGMRPYNPAEDGSEFETSESDGSDSDDVKDVRWSYSWKSTIRHAPPATA